MDRKANLFSLVVLIFVSLNLTGQENYNFSWVTGMESSNFPRIYDVAADSGKNIYVCGHTPQNVTFGNQSLNFPYEGGFLLKMDSARNVLWEKNIPGGSNESWSEVISTITDDAGNVYVMGYHRVSNVSTPHTVMFDTISKELNFSQTASAVQFLYLAKYNPSGDILWLKVGPTPLNNSRRDIQLEYSKGKVYLLSNYSAVPDMSSQPPVSQQFGNQPLMSLGASNNGTQAFISKVDTGGSIDWINFVTITNAPSLGSSRVYPGSISIDEQENIYFSGSTNQGTFAYNGNQQVINNFASFFGLFAVKIDSSGSYLNSFGTDGSFNFNNQLSRIQYLNGGVYLYGATDQTENITSSISVNDHFVVKFGSTLTPQTAYQIPISGYGDININGIEGEGDSSLIFYGQLDGTLNFPSESISRTRNTLIFKTDTAITDAVFNLASISSASLGNQAEFHGISKYYDNSYLAAGLAAGVSEFGYIHHSSPNHTNAVVTRIIPCSQLNTEAVADTVPICSQGASVTLEALGNPALDYQWLTGGQEIPGAENQTFTTNNTGTYQFYVDSLGCRDTSAEISVIQGAAPNVVSNPSSQLVCQTDSPFVLTGGSPTGGFWSGAGVINDSIFDPDSAGPGGHTLTYTFEDSLGCIDDASRNINVMIPPSVNILPLPDYCAGEAPQNIASYGLPQGGAFSGSGIQGGNVFDPQAAGIGSHTITYTYTDALGCENTDTSQIQVNPAPNAFINPIQPVCENVFSMPLSGASPSGGTWSGSHVMGTLFYPMLAGSGLHQITYTVNQNGCTASATETVQVDPAAGSIQAPAQLCLQDTPVVLHGTPAGGVFMGNGIVNDSVFDPALAGSGQQIIQYSFNNACSAVTETAIIEVTSVPALTFGSVPDQCSNDGPYPLSATPQGGVFVGDGVSGSDFYPTQVDTGTHELLYVYTVGSGCSDTAVQSVTVHESPQVDFQYATQTLCTGDSSVTLSGGTPAGGNYSGSGVSGTVFDPATAGTGVHDLVYSFTNSAGCTGSDTHQLTVYDGGPPIWSAPGQICENDAAFALQDGFPVGGTFSGTGVSGGIFDPAQAGVGSHAVTYSVQNNCGSGSVTDTLFVRSVTQASLTAPDSVCEGDVPVQLSGNPAGGNYFGSGVSSGQFNPAQAGSGSHSVYYELVNNNGCKDTAAENIFVNVDPQVSLVVQDSICVGAQPLNLSGGAPSGGVYTGTGVSSGLFTPSIGTGTYDIVYTYSDSLGCVGSDTQQITVYDTPDPSWTAPGALCYDAGMINLGSGNPAGGTFTGSGVSGFDFNPAIAGAGTHPVTYSVNTACGTKSVTDSVTVRALPQVALPAAEPFCSYESPVDLSQATSQGGVLAGPGIVNQTFDPDLAGQGNHQVIYSYTDSNGCSAADTQVYVVHPQPQVSFDPQENVCVNIPEFELTSGAPQGGTYSGNGVSGNQFDPAAAGIGTNELTYTFTDSNGCQNADSAMIEVLDAPQLSIPDETVCRGEEVVLTASEGDSVIWSTGHHGFELEVSPQNDTVFGVVSYYDNGCSDSGFATITVLDIPQPSIGADTAICISDSFIIASSGDFDSYDWSTGAAGEELEVTGSEFGEGNHLVWLTVTDVNGCSGSDSINLTVELCDTLGIGNLNTVDAEIKLYPNPSNGMFTVDIGWPLSENLELILVTAQGRRVSTMRAETEGVPEQVIFDARSIAPGNYFLIIKGESGRAVKRVVVGR